MVHAEHGFFVRFSRRAIVLSREFLLKGLQRVLDDVLLSLKSLQRQVGDVFFLCRQRNGLVDLGLQITALAETTGNVTHLSLGLVAVLAEDVIAPPAPGHGGTGVALDLQYVVAARASDGVLLAQLLLLGGLLGLESRHAGNIHHSTAETQD